MSLTLDYNSDDKVLYSDNTLVGRTAWGAYFLSIHVTDRGASITRYCVPGRIDTYAFDYIPGGSGIGDRITFFTDTMASLHRAAKLVQRDLKKKYVKKLLVEAKCKLPKTNYLTPLLEALR